MQGPEICATRCRVTNLVARDTSPRMPRHPVQGHEICATKCRVTNLVTRDTSPRMPRHRMQGHEICATVRYVRQDIACQTWSRETRHLKQDICSRPLSRPLSVSVETLDVPHSPRAHMPHTAKKYHKSPVRPPNPELSSTSPHYPLALWLPTRLA